MVCLFLTVSRRSSTKWRSSILGQHLLYLSLLSIANSSNLNSVKAKGNVHFLHNYKSKQIQISATRNLILNLNEMTYFGEHLIALFFTLIRGHEYSSSFSPKIIISGLLGFTPL